MNDRSGLTDRKRHLPELVLESESGGAALLRPGRSLLVVHIHAWTCAACMKYLEEVTSEADEITSWGCDIAVVVSTEPAARPDRLSPVFRVFYDAKSRFESALDTAVPGVVIADQWGDVILTRSAGPEHDFPPVAQLVSEVRYLGIRCPECEGEAL